MEVSVARCSGIQGVFCEVENSRSEGVWFRHLFPNASVDSPLLFLWPPKIPESELHFSRDSLFFSIVSSNTSILVVNSDSLVSAFLNSKVHN